MAGFTKSSLWGYWKFLFGDGSDGDVVISANTNLPSSDNGAIVYKNYRNLTINAGAVLSVSNPCRGLFIRVNGVLTLNGVISMSQKGCYVPNGGSDFYIAYDDIKIPAVSAAGAARSNMDSVGKNGANGVDGQCGGGGGGGGYSDLTGGAGAVGSVGGGGAGGSGAAEASFSGIRERKAGIDASPYGERGGATVVCLAMGNDDSWIRGYSGGGAGGMSAGGNGASLASGGILVVLANQIVGSGSMQAVGSNGGIGTEQFGGTNYEFLASRASAGGGSGGGSIVVFYNTSSWGGAYNVNGGIGGQTGYKKGGNGGNGSFRHWSLAQLASHTRL